MMQVVVAHQLLWRRRSCQITYSRTQLWSSLWLWWKLRTSRHSIPMSSASSSKTLNQSIRICLTCTSKLMYAQFNLPIDNRILIHLDIRPPINQPYKMLPPEVESARHFDLNITQWELPFVMRHLNSQSRHCRLDETCVRNCNKISLIFIFLFCKDFYVTYMLV